ncbi:hypothetical protein [Paractinoplanes durhamensis]|uniref:DUF3558 domain-containing protein n=1 Tax=Paractinoplanes durhamensis TaxID=113563 RepID=A0ABQ3ZET4_9ACTN|nr:hypothetical protein [Actinoplanes durhamensis]GIE08054.1 hypothetical protein Adu01nite_94040 [Actinoplanes durhamensis]
MRRLAVLAACLLTLGCAACDSPGGAAGGSTRLEPGLGAQPIESIAPDAENRVEPTLLTALPGLAPVPQDPERSDGIASVVCGNKPGAEAYTSWYGMRREWQGGGTTVRQFAGVFAAPTAAQAIAQVSGVLGCGSYEDREGKFTAVHKVPTPSADLAYCETVNGKSVMCTALLAREDILVRIETGAADEATASKALSDVVPKAAEALTKAW